MAKCLRLLARALLWMAPTGALGIAACVGSFSSGVTPAADAAPDGTSSIGEAGTSGDAGKPGDAGSSSDAGNLGDGGVAGDAGDFADGGGAADAVAAPCDLDAAFQAPQPVVGLATLASTARFSADEKTAYFALQPNDAGLDQLYQATRATLADPFGTPTPLTALNDALGESTPFVSADGKTIFYGHDEVSGGQRDIWFGTRVSTVATFGAPLPVGVVNDPADEDDYVSEASNQDLWFSSTRDGAAVLQIVHATYVGGGYGVPVAETEINSPTEGNYYPLVTADLKRIFFERGAAPAPVWTATRSIPSGLFTTPVVVNEVSTDPTANRPSWISTDGCRLYVGQGKPFITMVVATRPPP
ncbi:MAG TPA: hypothetical protein VGG39_15250 [Polyangiaceae bacterium]|jgi:hypothetical protein